MARRPSRPPLVLESFGHFFVGGRIDRSIEGSPAVGQMYVEFFIPRVLKSAYPLVMVHGNWQTGTNFTATPDGREGWAQYFLRRGYPVYIVDQVARGRSAHFSQSQGKAGPADLDRTERRFTSPKQHNRWPQAKRHTQWPGSGKAGDKFFDAFYATQFPSLVSNETSQALNRNGVVALLDRIGPAIVLTHSQSGAYGWLIADARPKLVKAVIAVEPNGPPVYKTDLKGSPEWFADIGARKRYGLTAVPLTYDPPLKDGEELAVVREHTPNAPGLVRGWLQAEPPRRLPNLAKIPVLVVAAEASYHAAFDHCTARWLTQAGVPTTFLRLEDAGLRGNGHMMMLEKNSDQVADVLADWIRQTLPTTRKTSAPRKRQH
jgi:pimeloyl-ACP methyl ester carboxylesterase